MRRHRLLVAEKSDFSEQRSLCGRESCAKSRNRSSAWLCRRSLRTMRAFIVGHGWVECSVASPVSLGEAFACFSGHPGVDLLRALLLIEERKVTRN